MTTDIKSIETLTEIVTREILSVLTEDEKTKTSLNGEYCKVECVDDLCVTTCFNEIGQVINAGAERITSTFGSLPDDLSTAQYIDHTLLKQDATHDQVTQLCKEAHEYKFASVCVNPTNVKLCAGLLKNSPVKVCSVIGFPLGAGLPETKAFETEQALKDGATEIDMVINIGALKDRNLDLVARDILAVVKPVHSAGALLKVRSP